MAKEWLWPAIFGKALLTDVIERLPCGFLGEAPDGTIRYANHRLLWWTGYEPEDLAGKPSLMLFPPELHKLLQADRERVLGGDCRTRLNTLQCKKGPTIPVALSRITYELPEDPTQLGIVSLIVDMGEIQTALPLGSEKGSLVAELSSIAQRLQSISQTTSLLRADDPTPAQHPLLGNLSPREQEVLERLVQGKRVPAISKEFFISPHTVRGHLKSIYRKLGVSSQSELLELVRRITRG